jgi:hypothetical protein
MIGTCRLEDEGNTDLLLDENRTEYWPGVGRAVLFGHPQESTSTRTNAEVSPSSLPLHLHSRRLIILMSLCRQNQPSKRPLHSRWCLVHHQLTSCRFLIIPTLFSG